MKGCREDSPDCIPDPHTLLSWITRVGFLPLFSNGIPGFSVEEHTVSADWWTDDPEKDPWIWRMILAQDPGVAYGKFFGQRAGFVSLEWFSDFANYRRDGYDMEGMYEDGKLSGKGKQILDVFEPNEFFEGKSLLACDVRKSSGISKGFEGALTDLQMKAFLLTNRFRQKINRRGKPYGWHVAELATPETKWGYDRVNLSEEKPEISWERITAQVKKYFPEAGEGELRRILGIRK